MFKIAESANFSIIFKLLLRWDIIIVLFVKSTKCVDSLGHIHLHQTKIVLALAG